MIWRGLCCSSRSIARLRFCKDTRTTRVTEPGLIAPESVSKSRGRLLCDRGLVADCQPMSGTANPDSCVAVGAAEVFTELMTFHFGAGGYDCGISVDSH